MIWICNIGQQTCRLKEPKSKRFWDPTESVTKNPSKHIKTPVCVHCRRSVRLTSIITGLVPPCNSTYVTENNTSYVKMVSCYIVSVLDSQMNDITSWKPLDFLQISLSDYCYELKAPFKWISPKVYVCIRLRTAHDFPSCCCGMSSDPAASLGLFLDSLSWFLHWSHSWSYSSLSRLSEYFMDFSS